MQEGQYFVTSWGHSSSGKLGQAQTNNNGGMYNAAQVQTGEKKNTILDIACGEGHSLLL